MKDFEERWNFPNLCGAMDGKHVNIRCPSLTGSQYFNYKKSFSTILFAVVDAKYNFLYFDVGTNGRVNDALVFSKSSFNAALESKTLNVPERGVFVGDDAFPLRKDLLKPFSRCGRLSQTQLIFNYRVSRARRVVENAFGILVSRFRIFEKPIPLSVATTELVVRCSCALHNWLQKTSPADHLKTQQSLLAAEDRDVRGAIPSSSSGSAPAGLENLSRAKPGNHTRAAGIMREHYAEMFITTHAVPWQQEKISM